MFEDSCEGPFRVQVPEFASQLLGLLLGLFVDFTFFFFFLKLAPLDVGGEVFSFLELKEALLEFFRARLLGFE